MKITVSGLAKARQKALAQIDAHFNAIASRSAHTDMLDLRLRIGGQSPASDPILEREADRQRLVNRMNTASIDEIAALLQELRDSPAL